MAPQKWGFLSRLKEIHFPGGLLVFTVVGESQNSAGLGLLSWNALMKLPPGGGGIQLCGGEPDDTPLKHPPLPLVNPLSGPGARVPDWGGISGNRQAGSAGTDWAPAFRGIIIGGVNTMAATLVKQQFSDLNLINFGALWPQPWPPYCKTPAHGVRMTSFAFINVGAVGITPLIMKIILIAAPDTGMHVDMKVDYYASPPQEFTLDSTNANVGSAYKTSVKPTATASYLTLNAVSAPTHQYFQLTATGTSLSLKKLTG